MLKYTALLTGGAVSTSFATVFLSGCAIPDDTTELHFFEANQFKLLSMIVDTILPRTDSPSATDVNVHHTIDSMIGLIFDERFKINFRTNWSELEEYLISRDFAQLEQAERERVLIGLEQNQTAETERSRIAYLELKQQTIAYYLTTEEIGTQHLNYLPIPGEYKPCISVEDVGNTAWAI